MKLFDPIIIILAYVLSAAFVLWIAIQLAVMFHN